MERSTRESVRPRVLIIAFLAASAAMLAGVNHVQDRIGDRRTQRLVASVFDASQNQARIDMEVDTLLVRYGIDLQEVRSWQVLTPEKRYIRSERRVLVGPDFNSLNFNLDLQRQVAPFGARVVATERTKESTVIMHLKLDGRIMQSISFVMKPK
jgi:hypothetical protein